MYDFSKYNLSFQDNEWSFITNFRPLPSPEVGIYVWCKKIQNPLWKVNLAKSLGFKNLKAMSLEIKISAAISGMRVFQAAMKSTKNSPLLTNLNIKFYYKKQKEWSLEKQK